MGKFLIFATAMLAFAFSAFGQSPEKKSSQPSKTERQILTLNREWADAMVRGDNAALERLFDDDLIVTSGNGVIRNKAAELGESKPNPDLKTLFFNTEEVRVRVYKDAAVVTGHAKWRINYKGRDIDNERRYMSVYAKRDGRWRMVALQITRFPLK